MSALRDGIKALAGASTADAIAIAPGDAFSDEELGDLGRAFGPVQAVIVLAQHIVDPVQMVRFNFSGTYRNSRIGGSFADALLRDTCWRIVGMLREAGYRAAIPRNGRLGMDDPRHHISYKKAGVLAGIGTFGRNQLLIHPEWGPWMLLRTVITDAPLPVDAMRGTSPCTDCAACIEACPCGALSLAGIDREACQIRYAGEAGASATTITISPMGQINCEECLRACRVGTAPPRIGSFQQ